VTINTGWTGLLGQNGGVLDSPGGLDPAYKLRSNVSRHPEKYISIYTPDDYEAILAQAYVEPDKAKRDAELQQLVRILNRDAIVIPLVYAVTPTLLQPWVMDCNIASSEFGIGGGILWNPSVAWLNK
jgi:ABC-type transport system substrate-binding protein